MSKNVERLNSTKVLNTIVLWGTRILFVASIIVLSILSFVESFDLSPDIRRVSTLGLVSMVLNWLVWDSYYLKQYEKMICDDIKNKNYCIHRRYYEARKGWAYKDLQDKIRKYNADFLEAWITDCEDITGRNRNEIVNGGYNKQSHKFLIWRLKHHKYPKTGIRTPNDVLYILSVCKADTMRINVKASEHHHTFGRTRKFLGSLFGCFLIAMLSYEFIKGDIATAIITLILNVCMLFMSLFFGSTAGIKGAKLKLSTAEIVSEKLEEWRCVKPSEEPYKEEEIVEQVEESKKETPSIQIV